MTSAVELASRRQRWLWGAVVTATVTVTYLVILTADDRWFYTDDTESGAVPNWIFLGRILRTGQFPSLVPEQWMAGNYPVEGQGGLWNPPQLLVNLISPSVDNMVLLATGVKWAFSVLLALGVYRICLEYGARAPWAAVAGAAVPFTGFALFFDQATWVTALTGSAWVAQAWASSLRYLRGRSGPLPAFVFLYLAISVGYVFPALVAGILAGCLVIGERIHMQSWRPSLKLAIVAACAAAGGLITYLPGVLSSSVTWRSDQGFQNDNFLTAPWSDTLNSGIPSALPAIEAWFGEVQPFPVTYIAWFAVPALAFVDWKAVHRSVRSLAGALIFLAAMLIATAGPSVMGPLRWPARLLPMFALAALVVVCVLVSRHGTLRNLPARAGAAATLVLVMTLRAGSSSPEFMNRHVLWAAAVLLVGALVLWTARHAGEWVVTTILLLSAPPVVYFQVASTTPHPLAWDLPARQSVAKANFPDRPGTTLQLGDRALVLRWTANPEGVYRSLVFGNFAKSLDETYVNAYTPIGFEEFAFHLCMRHDGSSCDDAFAAAFATEPSTGRTYVDLMLVDRVVLQRRQYPDADSEPAPPGWRWAQSPPGSADAVDAVILERIEGPVSGRNGRISFTEGVTATSVAEDYATSRVRVDSVDGGRVVFARLNWPGYTVTLDGRPLEARSVDEMFLAVDIPAGTEAGDLAVSWTPPGQVAGFVGLGLGIAGTAVMEVLYLRDRRKTRKERPEEDREQIAAATAG
ncbi:hypothetical protein NXT08_12505 [Rhodococcus pyridinivorans]|uniref:hypothetical protein n=1 Tax=Rhodococcus pyridinivorans TaxID=103816 RepID=UPI002164051D|nr:hypothetical protein [Rhodococcus pyridinivorans]UVT23193.1 hypothetical protein NXT08_12505 [Rhodococcus pyridinivorans]